MLRNFCFPRQKDVTIASLEKFILESFILHNEALPVHDEIVALRVDVCDCSEFFDHSKIAF